MQRRQEKRRANAEETGTDRPAKKSVHRCTFPGCGLAFLSAYQLTLHKKKCRAHSVTRPTEEKRLILLQRWCTPMLYAVFLYIPLSICLLALRLKFLFVFLCVFVCVCVCFDVTVWLLFQVPLW